ncbi:MAG: 4-hydroxy-tetrahydrodipicolinate synthase [Candidatus Riflebacteria bacterium]|nr:4-hydroxy-tetrahydrodipicolinate synthase [Candidatus Riflebacteria bacterium]
MKNNIFLKGSWVALATPFKENGDIDLKALDRLLELHIQSKTDGIVICGTTGEAPSLNHDERKLIMQRAREATKGTVPLMLGTGSNSTQLTCDLTAEAKSLGADAVLVVTPYYNKPTQTGLKLHYDAVAKATSLPVVLYNVPGRTGCNIKPETVLELSSIPNIVALKEASGDVCQFSELKRILPPEFALFSGEDALNYPLLALGGKGTISVTANVEPVLMKQFNDLMLAGNFIAARDIHMRLYPLHKALFIETNPIPTKAALSLKNYCQANMRLPLSFPAPETFKSIEKALQQIN